MLVHKMIRDIKTNAGQFITIFIFSILAMLVFVTLKSESLGGFKRLEEYNKETNRADGWMYGESFTEDNLTDVKNMKEIEDAQLRTSFTAKAVRQNNTQLEVFLQNENRISIPVLIEGEPVDFSNSEKIWVDYRFANAWDIKLGDEFVIGYENYEVKRTVAGFVESSEFLYYYSDIDMDSNFKNIGYAFLSDDLSKDNLIVDKLPKTEMIFKTKSDVMGLESQLSDVLDDNYAVLIDKTKKTAIESFYTELEQHEMLAFVYPLVFVIFSILLIMTTMRRIVDKQRVQIGTMNALGVSRLRIRMHYIGFGFFITVIGGFIGIIIGRYILGQAVVNLFLDYYVLPGWKAGTDATVWIVYGGLVIASVLASWLAISKVLKINPSEALKPSAPKAGKSSFIEKMPFWDKLSFNVQYVLRDISRYKLRAIMSLIGMIACTMLMVMAMNCNTMLSETTKWYFDKICRYENQGNLKDGIKLEDADITADACNGELLMFDDVEIALNKNAVAADRIEVTMIASENKGLFGLTDTDFNITEIPEGKIAITKKTAEKLGVGVGDTIYWHFYKKNTWYKSEIGLINRNPTISGITMYRDYLDAEGIEFTPSQILSNEDIEGIENISKVNTAEEIKKSFETSLSAMSMIVYLLSVFSMIFGIVVLYNSGSISFEERRKEFATLKVLGFETKHIRKLMTIGNVWTTILGILIGLPFGPMLLEWMLSTDGSSLDFNVFIKPIDFIISGGFVLVVSCLVGFMFSRRIRKLDMVEE